MKIPQPKKLPSGKWRVQIMVAGTRRSRTFPTEAEALHYATGVKTKMAEAEAAPSEKTVSQAATAYIEASRAVLSPSTIAGYIKIRDNWLGTLEHVKVRDISQEQVQRWVNNMKQAGKSPKTISNAHGFLSSVLKQARPALHLTTKLPQKQKKEIHIPTEEEIRKIMAAAKGTKNEFPFALAVWLGLRASEIIALTSDSIHGEYLTVNTAMVLDEHRDLTAKDPKTYSGYRTLHLPPEIVALIPETKRPDKRLVPRTGGALYKALLRTCEKAGVPPYSFHALRHANASIMLANGVPDKYAMKRMGHATTHMLKTVYQHTMQDKETQVTAQVEAAVRSMLNPGK